MAKLRFLAELPLGCVVAFEVVGAMYFICISRTTMPGCLSVVLLVQCSQGGHCCAHKARGLCGIAYPLLCLFVSSCSSLLMLARAVLGTGPSVSAPGCYSVSVPQRCFSRVYKAVSLDLVGLWAMGKV